MTAAAPAAGAEVVECSTRWGTLAAGILLAALLGAPTGLLLVRRLLRRWWPRGEPHPLHDESRDDEGGTGPRLPGVADVYGLWAHPHRDSREDRG